MENAEDAIRQFVAQVEFDYKRGLIGKKEFEYIKATMEGAK